MSKLEHIRQILSNDPDLIWNEQSTHLRHLRREGSYYSVAFRVAPKSPILESRSFQRFSRRLTEKLVPAGPTSVTKCYEYPGVRRDVIKTATLYYSEEIGQFREKDPVERRITISIYPCQVMAENMGVRGIIEIRRYACPSPCEKAKKCTFKGYGKGILYDVGVGKTW